MIFFFDLATKVIKAQIFFIGCRVGFSVEVVLAKGGDGFWRK